MREVVKGDKKIEPARASLIRAAVDFGFRSHVYDDVIDRLKTVEKKQSEAKNVNSTQNYPRKQALTANGRIATVAKGAARVSKRLSQRAESTPKRSRKISTAHGDLGREPRA